MMTSTLNDDFSLNLAAFQEAGFTSRSLTTLIFPKLQAYENRNLFIRYSTYHKPARYGPVQNGYF